MSLTLKNNLNQALYSIDTLITISEASDYTINLVLKALQSKAQLSLATSQSFNTQISVSYPGSLKRVPQAANEVIFTELLPNPKTSGDNWEWFEVYNTTNDTLLMSNCMIGKTSTSNTASTAWTMDSTITLLPHQMTVFGRENVSFASYHYSGLTLSNTAQSLVLTCNRTKIDSVEYRSPTDSLNPYPLYTAKTLQVKQDSVYSRLKGSSWCNSNQTITSDSLTINASPFSWGSCQ